MIGFYGGSFDPLHLGHLHVAKSLLNRYHFSRLYFVPAYQNPLKDVPQADASARLEMLEAGLSEENCPQYAILDWEIRKPEKSFTVETIEDFKKTTDEDICLIMGDEVFEGLPQWKDPAKLLRSAHLIIECRTPNLQRLIALIPRVLGNIGVENFVDAGHHRFLHSGGTRWIDVQNVSPLPFSATAIRREISGLWKSTHIADPPYGIQRSVWQVIKEKRLYAVT